MTDTTTDDARVVTDERAQMLANHAIYVQGGFSTPEIERERAEKDMARGGPIDWAKMQAEVDDAIKARLAAMPTVPPTPAAPEAPEAPEPATRTDVTAAIASIDQGEALRDRIDTLKKELKVHEDRIKDLMGEAVEGVDAKGNVLVRLPHRNRTTLVAKEVAKRLSPADLAACQNVTSYRALLYGA